MPDGAASRLDRGVDKTRRKQIDRGDIYAEFGDPAPVQILALEGNRFDPDTPWSVPLVAKVRVYFQFLPHEDVAAVMGEVKRSLAEFAANGPLLQRLSPRVARHRLAAALRARPRARPPLDRLPRVERQRRPRPRSAAVGRRVPLRRIPPPARVRHPHAPLRPHGRRRAQRQRVREAVVRHRNRRNAPRRRARLVRVRAAHLPGTIRPERRREGRGHQVCPRRGCVSEA